jgi:hypothetical protein
MSTELPVVLGTGTLARKIAGLVFLLTLRDGGKVGTLTPRVCGLHVLDPDRFTLQRKAVGCVGEFLIIYLMLSVLFPYRYLPVKG